MMERYWGRWTNQMISQRRQVLAMLATRIARLPRKRFARVAIDGVDGAGKTTFADELALLLETVGVPTIRASVDGFHNARSVRYKRGKGSSDGFYLDSYNYGELRSRLLDPLEPEGSGRYQDRAFDHLTDSVVSAPVKCAEVGSALLFDGIFLHRPELRELWNFSIFLLDVPFDVSIPRGAARGPDFGSPDPKAASNQRYIEGQRRYLRECDPTNLASVVIDNRILDAPFVARDSDNA